MPTELQITNQWAPGKRLPIPRRRLQAILDSLFRSEGVTDVREVSLVFCDDAFIRELNRAHRGKDAPTDVLSFPQERLHGCLGDIVLSVPTCRRQARATGRPASSEMEWLVLHGALHCLGYDDDTDVAAAAMDDRARAALALLDPLDGTRAAAR